MLGQNNLECFPMTKLFRTGPVFDGEARSLPQ